MFYITHTQSRMRRLISVYLDGELDPKRTRRLMAHVEQCARCRDELAEATRLTSRLFSALSKEETPDILADVLSALDSRRLSESRRTARRFDFSLRPVLAYSAAAVFGIAVGILVSSSFGVSTDTATTDTLPVEYLSEAPPNSLITLYYGDTGEVVNE